jgi:hypothetical protein
MILKFSVENFKSIKQPVVFDLECSSLKDSDAKNRTKILPGEGDFYKKVCAIYGSNASGKSNFIKALATMSRIILTSLTLAPGDTLDYSPFKFASGYLQKPTLFSIELLLRGVRYVYSFSYSREGIVTEKLQYAPNRYTILVFERNGNEYRFGNDEKTLLPLEKLTSGNKLFLATAASFNYTPCVSVFSFFKNDLIFDYQNQTYTSNAGANLFNEISEKLIKEEPFREFALSLLQAADINISSLTPKPLASSQKKSQLPVSDAYSLLVGHQVSGKEYFLPLEEESDGTQSVLFLSYFFYLAKTGKKVLLVDELDQSLHTLLLPFLVNLFAEICSQSQFFFTTHDSSLMRECSLRRDEYYFTQKGDDASTLLYPLSEFSVRRNAKIEDEYLEGRFGAVPQIKDGLVQ